MIEIMQGALGSGKSAVATARAIHHIQRGGVVAANFSLTDGWSESVARRHIWSRFDDEFRYQKSASMYERFYRVDSLDAIIKIKPREQAVGLLKDDGTYSEGQGLLILDECHLVFNCRKWEKNSDWIHFLSQSRKLGWNVLLIAHAKEMIDSQIRPLAEYESTFRNLQRVKIPFTPLPLSPFPLFLVIQRYSGLGAGASVVASRDMYPLPLWAAQLYDSMHIFNSEAWGKESEPILCGSRPPAPLCGVGGLDPPPIRPYLSQLSPCCLWTQFENQTS